MNDYENKFGKLTLGNFTIKVIGGKSFGKKFRYEYGLFDSNDALIFKNDNLEKLKELASKRQKENHDISD